MGQAPTAPEGADTIRAMREYAAGRIEILPGCGVRLNNAAWLLERTGCRQLHASLKTARLDRSATHNPCVHFSGGACPPEEEYPATDAGAVRRLAALARE